MVSVDEVDDAADLVGAQQAAGHLGDGAEGHVVQEQQVQVGLPGALGPAQESGQDAVGAATERAAGVLEVAQRVVRAELAALRDGGITGEGPCLGHRPQGRLGDGAGGGGIGRGRREDAVLEMQRRLEHPVAAVAADDDHGVASLDRPGLAVAVVVPEGPLGQLDRDLPALPGGELDPGEAPELVHGALDRG